jgi:hypothetical protein
MATAEPRQFGQFRGDAGGGAAGAVDRRRDSLSSSCSKVQVSTLGWTQHESEENPACQAELCIQTMFESFQKHFFAYSKTLLQALKEHCRQSGLWHRCADSA